MQSVFLKCSPRDFPGGPLAKTPCCRCRGPGFNPWSCRRHGFDPWVRKIPWRREWQPALVVLPGKSHGQRILAGYSPQSCKESDTTQQLHFHFLYAFHAGIPTILAGFMFLQRSDHLLTGNIFYLFDKLYFI